QRDFFKLKNLTVTHTWNSTESARSTRLHESVKKVMHNLQNEQANTNTQFSWPRDREKRGGRHGTWPILLGDLTLTLVDRAGSSTPAF
ncbi:MAG: hypothetical protein ABIQ18_19635, partial [Umezawaea sp.]